MTQNIIPATLIALGLIISGYLFASRDVTISTAPAVKTLQVTADAKVNSTPDTVIISAGVEIHKRQTQELAYNDMNTSINAVKDILKKAWIEDKNIQTSNLSVGPEYIYDNGKQTLDGYQAYTTLDIRVEKKDQSVTNTILDSMAKVPDIRMNGVSYDIADKEWIYAEARKMALEKARTKADAMAKISWVSIISIQSISEATDGGNVPMYKNMRALDMAGSAQSEASDISLGQVEYSAMVNVSYEIR